MFDPADPDFLADPYPVFAALREQGPVHWHEGLGLYIAVSHAACDALLRNRALGRIWRDREPVDLFPAFNLLHRTSILESEPPTHTRLRRLVAGAFGRGHVERMRPWVAGMANQLVGELAEELRAGRPTDLIAAVAEPLPVEVIAELLGVPHSDRGLLRPWSNAIVKMYEYGLGADLQAVAETAAREFVAYLRELVAERRLRPGDADLISDLVAAADGADRLSQDEIVGTCVLLLMAGHEATVNVVGNGVNALAHRPAQWRRLVAEPALAVPGAEEMTRFDSSLQLFERTATKDLDLLGTPIQAGQKVAALLGAANRDPAVFADPDRFDVGRDVNSHLGFGAGIHFCLGAPLARIEVQSVIGALAAQVPELHLNAEPIRRPEFVIRGLTALELA
ncbi:MAG TPA: cytochrome P450 [Kineosporiaceae bacterium]|nr:cytochrome P450 [Kineosporiaceae bacterium]